MTRWMVGGRALAVAAALGLVFTGCPKKEEGPAGGGSDPAAEDGDPAEKTSACTTELGKQDDGSYVYTLSADAVARYPQKAADDSPEAKVFDDFYVQFYEDLDKTIEHFTNLSLERDALKATAEVCLDAGAATITLKGDGDLERFAKQHQRFMDAGAAGLDGSVKCADTDGCWDPKPGDQPWSWMLPLGLPMSQQKAVMLLNYPPSDALCGRDYLNNYTMWRVEQVFGAIGLTKEETRLYETIIDSRPIAAPGSGQSSYMPSIETYYQGYIEAMSQALANDGPAPFFILGTPAQGAWEDLTGQEADTGTGGTAKLGDLEVNWISANHPDVTSYNCCYNDTNSKCTELYNGEPSTFLVSDEITDLYTYCAIVAVSAGAPPDQALAACKKQWCWNESDPEQPAPGCKRTRDICVRARQDYSWDSPDSDCKCPKAAEAFCTKYQDDPCPTPEGDDKAVSCTEFNKLCGDTSNNWTSCPDDDTSSESDSQKAKPANLKAWKLKKAKKAAPATPPANKREH